MDIFAININDITLVQLTKVFYFSIECAIFPCNNCIKTENLTTFARSKNF